MEVEYDGEKRAKTLQERGLDFARAEEIFDGAEFTWVADPSELR